MARARRSDDLTPRRQREDVPAPRQPRRLAAAPAGELPEEWVAAVGVRAPALALDGRLAYVADGPDGPRLWVRSVDGRRRRVDTGPGHVRTALWSPGGALLAVQVAPGGGELTEVRVVDPAGRRTTTGRRAGTDGRADGVRWLAGGDGRAAAPARWSADGQALLVTESDRADAGGRTTVVLVALDGRRVTLAEGIALQILDAVALDDAPAGAAGPEAAPALAMPPGAVATGVGPAESAHCGDPLAASYRLLLREGPRGVRRALVVDVRLTASAIGGDTHASWELPGGTATALSGQFTAGGRRALLACDLGRERIALLDVAVDAPGAPVVVAERPDADVEWFAPLGSVGSGAARVAVAWNVAGRSELALVDLAGAGAHTALPAPPRAVVTALLARPGGRELILAVEDSAAPPEIWTCTLPAPTPAAGAPAPTAVPAPVVPGSGMSVPGMSGPVVTGPVVSGPVVSGPVVMGAVVVGADYRCLISRAPARAAALVRPVARTLRAHDGLTLSGWWYRPPSPPGPLPTMIYLHGGPEAQDRPTFNPLLQALVARGIAVFAPNVRGSSGYGRSFEEADHLEHRADGIEDVASCVRDLVGAGLVDPRRIGVAGRSYGGYLTLAALVRFPELFQAGMDVCGMADLETFYQHTEPWIAASAVTKYGDPRTQAELLRALSPLHRMDALAAPLLVVHGANDTNVPLVEAEQAVAAATANGVDCRYLLFPDEGHEVVGLVGRVRFVRAAVDWFAGRLLGTHPSPPRETVSAGPAQTGTTMTESALPQYPV